MRLLLSDIRLGTEPCRDRHQTHPERSAEELQRAFSLSARPRNVSSMCGASATTMIVFECLCLQGLSSYLLPPNSGGQTLHQGHGPILAGPREHSHIP